MSYLGDFSTTATVYFWFDTVNGQGMSVSASGFAGTDIKIYKNGSTVERTSTAGYAVFTDFDASTGINMFSVDLTNNTDAGFYSTGAEYAAVVNSINVNGSTRRFIAGTFSIRRPRNVTVVTVSTGAAQTINAEVDVALSDYDGPTNAEMNANSTATDALIVAKSTETQALVSGLNDLASSDVNAQVVDVVNVDTFGAASGAPPATTTLVNKISFLYSALTQQITTRSSGKTFHSTDNAVQWVKGLSDDGTTYTETLASTST